jgi:tetrahydromethanopterin S-methyltransferase subunit F
MAEEAKPAVAGGAVRMVAIDTMVENIRYKAQIIARSNKTESAMMTSGLKGFLAGLVLAMVFVVIPAFLIKWMG